MSRVSECESALWANRSTLRKIGKKIKVFRFIAYVFRIGPLITESYSVLPRGTQNPRKSCRKWRILTLLRGQVFSGKSAKLAFTKTFISRKRIVCWASNFEWKSIYNGIPAEPNLSHVAKGFILLNSIFLHTC